MSSIGVDFRFFLDTQETGIGEPHEETFWRHDVALVWSSAGEEHDPAEPFEIRISLYPGGAPDLVTQIGDWRDVIAAEVGGVTAVLDKIDEVYGTAVHDEVVALCITGGVPNKYAHAFGQHMKILRKLLRSRAL